MKHEWILSGVALLAVLAALALSIWRIRVALEAERKLLERAAADPEVRRIIARIYAADPSGRVPPEWAPTLRAAFARNLASLAPREQSDVSGGLLQDSIVGRARYLAKLVRALAPRVLGQAARA